MGRSIHQDGRIRIATGTTGPGCRNLLLPHASPLKIDREACFILSFILLTHTSSMCRLAAYLGPRISLQHFLQEPEHSLLRQSWAPQEMREAVVNADGYGLGWHDTDGRALIYTCARPIWADGNLEALGCSLSSLLWVGNVRSATPGQSVGEANTQPFRKDGWLYLHNGYIQDFNSNLRAEFHRRLPADLLASLQGNSDSEYLFALIWHHYREDTDLQTALRAAWQTLDNMLAGRSALLNVVLAGAGQLMACRHAINGTCPSLYYCRDTKHFPDAVLVASEPLDNSDAWQPIPAQHLLILKQEGTWEEAL